MWFILFEIFAFGSTHCGGVRRTDGVTTLAPVVSSFANPLKGSGKV